MERELLYDLDAWLRKGSDSPERNMSGPEAYKRIVCEYEKKLQRARSEKSKKKYQATLEFLNSYMQQGMEQKRKLYSFCADISALDTRNAGFERISYYQETDHLSSILFFGADSEAVISKRAKSNACEKFNFDERELEKFIRQCGSAETFPELVNDYMGKKGMGPKDVYQNANLSRQDFSRVTKPGAKPKRETIYSVAIGLQASWEETTKLLSSVGYAFRKNSKFDVILRYCIQNKMYEISRINEALYSYGQKTLAMNGPVKVTDDLTR